MPRRARRSRVPRRRGVPLVLALGALSGGCQTLDATVWNLRQLHTEDGSPRRRAALRSGSEQAFAELFEALRMDMDSTELHEKTIDDPFGECLENLVVLKELDSDDPAVLGAKCEIYSWLALEDTYALSRERCYLELGGLAERLGVHGPRSLPQDVEPAGPAEIEDALARVVRGLDTRGEAPFRAAEGTAGDALLDVEALHLDLPAARRLLAGLTALIGIAPDGTASAARLLALQREAAAVCVGLALGPGLEDPSPLVRAAALEANTRARGHADSTLYEAALKDPSLEVLHRLLLLVARTGLPEPDPQDETPPVGSLDPADAYRSKWLQALVDLTRSYEGRLSLAACRALSEVSDSGFRSIRSEEWVSWWQSRKDQLLEQEVHGTR